MIRSERKAVNKSKTEINAKKGGYGEKHQVVRAHIAPRLNLHRCMLGLRIRLRN